MARAHWQLIQKRTWWGGRQPGQDPRPCSGGRLATLAVPQPPPSTCPKSLLPRGEQLLKTSRKELSGQCLSLAPPTSIFLGQIQSTLVPRDKRPMYTRGKAKIIPLDTNRHRHLSYPQILTLLPHCLNSNDRSITLLPPRGTTGGWLPLYLPAHTISCLPQSRTAEAFEGGHLPTLLKTENPFSS